MAMYCILTYNSECNGCGQCRADIEDEDEEEEETDTMALIWKFIHELEKEKESSMVQSEDSNSGDYK